MILKTARFALLAATLWLGAATLAHALELRDVLERTQVSPPDRVGFREMRYNPLLKEPLELAGYLEYPQAGQLRKVIESPFQESMLVDGDTIELVRDGRTRRVSLKNRKSILTVLQSIEALLASDTEMLEQLFEFELTGTAENWQLRLSPNAARVTKQLDRLTVCGGARAINEIRFDMQNGEWQHLEIIQATTEP